MNVDDASLDGNESPGDNQTAESDNNDYENDGWIDLLGNGQLLRKVTKEGDNELAKPRFRSKVTIRFEGHLDSLDGAVIDSAATKSIILGFSDLISALEMCIQAMHVGEINQLKSGPRFAFGQLGKEPEVPGDATVVYEVELLDVNETYNMEDMTIQQWILFANERKDRGNYFYHRKEHDKAVDVYNKILSAIEPILQSIPDDDKTEVNECVSNLYNNMAAAQLKLEDLESCLKSCEKVLKINSDNYKALYRKGKVLMAQNRLQEACLAFQAAAKIQGSTLIQKELNSVKLKLKKQCDKEKVLYSKMLEVEPPKRIRNTLVIGRRVLLGSLLAILLAIGIFHLLPRHSKLND